LVAAYEEPVTLRESRVIDKRDIYKAIQQEDKAAIKLVDKSAAR
jgi:hypothetical protein